MSVKKEKITFSSFTAFILGSLISFHFILKLNLIKLINSSNLVTSYCHDTLTLSQGESAA